MSTENREQQVDQLLRGIYRMCVTRDDCKDCPFHITKCTFGEPRPSTWFDEETIENKFAPNYLRFTDRDIVIEAKEEPEPSEQPAVRPAPQQIAAAEQPVSEPDPEPTPVPQPEPQSIIQTTSNPDEDGTWLVSTTMGSVFTKYVFICSKCGYRKESMFSFTPMTNCPECEKRKAGITQQ